ncbi:Dullard-like phosphatase domain-containing protein [Trypanosoma rangeli]|uniref:Dullard-like phosphatase domain-containing protein n=1 Tax=Trypanosoma rangeli TaxID=5698 RepID=A0A3S5ISI0_TRYRA|nr:Dullard-like phosphatase domain-containing protein [Trypanosoma rangeli]RNF11373.1 Dullard-like phosphatase domain-containing protein [Trypanosoma rangeli]|eukprot:RNF11373.1 Dullard-like phosphatase domain-containing protein [Trypanosoma rangeli]
MHRSRGGVNDIRSRGGSARGSGRSGGRAWLPQYCQGHMPSSSLLQLSRPSQPGAASVDENPQEMLDPALTVSRQGEAGTQCFCAHHQHPRQFHYQQNHRVQVIPITSVHDGTNEISRVHTGLGVADSVHLKRHEVSSSGAYEASMGEHPHNTSPMERNVMFPPPLWSGPRSSLHGWSHFTRGRSTLPQQSRQSLQSSAPARFSGGRGARVLHSGQRTRKPKDGIRQKACSQSLGGLERAGGTRTVALDCRVTNLRRRQQTEQGTSSLRQRGGSSPKVELYSHQSPVYELGESRFSTPLCLETSETANPAASQPYRITHRHLCFSNYCQHYTPASSEASVSPDKVGATLIVTENSGSKDTTTVETAVWEQRQQGQGQYEQRESEKGSIDDLDSTSLPPARCAQVPSSDKSPLVHSPVSLSSKQLQRQPHQADTDRNDTGPNYLLPPRPECYSGCITCCLDLDNTLVYTFQWPPSWWDPENNPLHLEIEIDSSSARVKGSNFDRKISDDYRNVTSPSFLSSQSLDLDSGMDVTEPPSRDQVCPGISDCHYVCIRPHALEFVQFCLAKFEVVFFTSGTEEYARPIFDYLEPKRVAHRLYRHHCTEYREGMYRKDLSLLGRPLDSVILFDDRGPDASFQPRNVLFCEPFILEEVNDAYGLSTKDDELCGYMEFLEMLTNLQREVMLQAIAAYQEEVMKVTLVLLTDEVQTLEETSGVGADVGWKESS